MHVDIAGVMENKDEVSYLSSGMSGQWTVYISTAYMNFEFLENKFNGSNAYSLIVIILKYF